MVILTTGQGVGGAAGLDRQWGPTQPVRLTEIKSRKKKKMDFSGTKIKKNIQSESVLKTCLGDQPYNLGFKGNLPDQVDEL